MVSSQLLTGNKLNDNNNEAWPLGKRKAVKSGTWLHQSLHN